MVCELRYDIDQGRFYSELLNLVHCESSTFICDISTVERDQKVYLAIRMSKAIKCPGQNLVAEDTEVEQLNQLFNLLYSCGTFDGITHLVEY